MGRITSSVGLASGIDTKSIIDQLMALEEKPKTDLQTRIDDGNEKKLAYTDLNTRLSSLKLIGTSLKKPSTFQASSASSTDEDVLTATAGNAAAVGSYQLQVARLVSTQQSVTAGFSDLDKTGVGPGTISLELGGGDLSSTTLLSQLNGGNGISRGQFKITDRSGASTVIDLSTAVSVDDVLKRINTSLGVSVRASVSGDHIVISDLTSKTVSNLTIADLGGGSTAVGLGLVADNATAAITGTDINSLGVKTALDDLNDGQGVRRTSTGADFQITAGNGATFAVTLGSAKTVGDVITLINAATGGRVKADVAPGGNGIRLTDTVSGAPSVSALAGSNAATDLGIVGTGTGTTLNGTDLIAGLDTVLLKSLKGGAGLTLGQISITDRHGTIGTINLAGAKSVQDVLDAINNNAAGVRVTASLKESGNGIEINDDTGEAGNLIIANAGGSTSATDLGLAGTFDTNTLAVQGANLQRRWISENTQLSTLNGGKGVNAGTFKITNAAGITATVELPDGANARLGDIISAINAKGAGVTASVNGNGDGLLLTDTSGGAGKLKVEDVDSTTAADLNINGTATATSLDGSFEKSITVLATDTLTDVQSKINALNFGASATIINDGTGTSPYRLSLTSRNSGRAGRVIIDGGATKIQATNLVQAQDAAVFVGGADAAQPLLVTSSRNQLTGVIQGVTLELHGTSTAPVSLNIARTADTMVDQLQSFTDKFNDLVDKTTDLTKFDADTNEKGILLGDATIQTVQQDIYAVFTGTVSSAGKYHTAADVGLTLGDGGKIAFDEDKFRTAFANDPKSVQTLFTTTQAAITRSTPLSNINSGRGVRTAPGGAADFRVTTQDGTVTDVTLGTINSVGDVLNSINSAGAGKFSAQVSPDGTGFVLNDTSASGTTPFTVAPLNGSVASTDLKIVGTGTAGAITGAKVVDVATSLSLAPGTGLGYLIENSMTKLIDPVDGAITIENQQLDDKNTNFQAQIDRLDDLIAKKRARLESQFAQMESVISGLQGQQSALSSLTSSSK